MGVTISHTLGQEKQRVKATLDKVQQMAEDIQQFQAKTLQISFEIRREDDNTLLIDIGHCETLGFCFKQFSEMYEWTQSDFAVFDNADNEHIKSYPGQELYWCSDFCKTQFSKSLVEHKWVADLIGRCAGYCRIAKVYDEGDYYHTGNIEDASEAIEENGALISSITGKLTGMGWDDTEIIKGGETTIKPLRSKK